MPDHDGCPGYSVTRKKRRGYVNLHISSDVTNVKAFLDRIITTDNYWLWFYDPVTKQQSAVWKRSSSHPPEKARVNKSGAKYMFIMVHGQAWDAALSLCAAGPDG